VNIYRINDVLASLANEAGVTLDDDTIDDLTHYVAAVLGVHDLR